MFDYLLYMYTCREAWRVALSDINKLTVINRQLVDLGKEMNQCVINDY